MATKRYQRRFGNLPRMVTDQGEVESARRVSSALNNFTSVASGLALNEINKLQTKKGREDAAEYDPTGGAPELREGNFFTSKADETYNRQVLEAHNLYIQNQISADLKNFQTQYANNPSGYQTAVNQYLQTTSNNIDPSLANKILPKYQALTDATYDSIKFIHQQKNIEFGKQQQKAHVTNELDDLIKSIISTQPPVIEPGDDEKTIQEKTSKYQNDLSVALGNAQQFLIDISQSSFLTTEEVQAIQKAGTQGIYEAEVTNFLNKQDPIDAIADIENSLRNLYPDIYEKDEWDAFIKSAISLQNTRNSSQTKIEADRQKEFKDVVDLMDISINRFDHTTTEEEIVEMQKSINQLRLQEYDGWADKQKALDNKIKSIGVDNQAYSELYATLDSNAPFYGNINDAQFTKITDRYFDDIKDNPNKLDIQLKFIETINQVPNRIVNEAKKGLLVDDPTILLESANTVMMVQQTSANRRIKLPFDDSDVAFAQHIVDGLDLGLTAKESIEKAQSIVSPTNSAVLDARKRKFADKYGNDEKAIEKFIGKAKGIYRFASADNQNDIVMAEVGEDYQRLTERFVMLGLDPEDAEKKAKTQIKDMWGKSIVGNVMMRMPPENIYTIDGNKELSDRDDTWIQEQLLEDTQGLGMTDVFLFADERTLREDLPSYVVYGMTENGIQVLPQRYRPDTEKEIARRTILGYKKGAEDFLSEVGTEKVPVTRESIRTGIPITTMQEQPDPDFVEPETMPGVATPLEFPFEVPERFANLEDGLYQDERGTYYVIQSGRMFVDPDYKASSQPGGRRRERR